MTVYLNIGSNQGDCKALIERAIALIAIAYPEASVRRSNYIESEPWGYDSPNKFLNIGLALDFAEAVEPLDVLHTMQRIEKDISPGSHRNADGTYRDRKIDIDIIEIDNIVMDTPELTLPHPRAHLRAFVQIPLRQLKHPQ